MSLNYSDFLKSILDTYDRIPEGNLPIFLDDVDCPLEGSIEDCTHLGWEEDNCSHSEDIYLSCSG